MASCVRHSKPILEFQQLLQSGIHNADLCATARYPNSSCVPRAAGNGSWPVKPLEPIVGCWVSIHAKVATVNSTRDCSQSGTSETGWRFISATWVPAKCLRNLDGR